MKIGIFTPYPLDPLHPRTEMISKFLESSGYIVTVIPNKQKKGRFWNFLSLISLKYFDIASFPDFVSQLGIYDIVFIQDLNDLPLAYFAKRHGKFVIYETLDNNVHLRFYHLLKRFSFLKYCRFFIPIFEKIEKFLAFRYTDKIIVNSKALLDYFQGEAKTIFYASPFERLSFSSSSSKKVALLYLGIISDEKGFFEMLDLQERLGSKLFLFGNSHDQTILSIINSNPNLVWKTRLTSLILIEELAKLAREYFLIGLSLVKPVHYSYATQELNKDIDYLAMGVPIIGNHRQPTEEKILAGCGVFVENIKGISELFNDPDIQSQVSKRCKEYYYANYSQALFEEQLLETLEQVYDQ